ncbi:MAG: EAL domain-containing protein [Pseudomonadota bacterium]|nr:EAL domain-containing protein [Pseudomonadota bacterium]
MRRLAVISLWPIATVAVALACTLPTPTGAIPLALLVAALLVWNGRLRQVIAQAQARLTNANATEPQTTLDDGLDAIEQRLAAVDHRLAATHPVSGLPMREALLAHINADQHGLLGAVAFVDFDRLTAFDPVLGERVFATATARLRRMLPPGRFLAQVDRGHVGIWFGDDFSDRDARAELDAISYALGETITEQGHEITPQVHVRLARFDPGDGLTAAAFLARTLASFTLSGAQKSTLTDGPPVDHAAVARDRYALEQDLRQAIVRRELRLDFQPLIDAAKGTVCGAEALIRWDHADRGAISPARFVPVVEAMGLASEIGNWALNAAVRTASEWRAAGLRDVSVAVNVSGLQLERDDLPILVQRTLQRHDMPARALEIELTESVATSDERHCRVIFEQLRAHGVKLAVDDFGTGYSGFSSLRALAFDKIKIDREFVTAVHTRRDSQAICQSIIALGRGLGIRVLAEGVEERAEYAWLRRHGCHHFQGYYFGRPMSPAAFVAFAGDTDTLIRRLALDIGPNHLTERLSA